MNIIGKIELPNREVKINPERYQDFLSSKMLEIQQEVNGAYGKFLNRDAVIEMAGVPEVIEDKKQIKEQEETWANEQYKDLETWRADKNRNVSNIAEMAVTLALHRFLKDRFIVARASKYDDYNHGVDNVIIDKETGAIICGFDEVVALDAEHDGGQKKFKKIKNNLEHGGTEIKYGATVVDNKLQRQSFKNIPTFFISLSKKDLDTLLLALQKDQGRSESVAIILSQLVESLEEQYAAFSDLNLNNNLKNNFAKFSDSLSLIKSLVKSE